MKHTMNHIWSLVLVVLFGVGQFALTSCSDSDSGGGAPEITGVRTTDPAQADSLFTKASAGSKIVIVGKNLGGAQYIYINGQQVSFNSTLNTDHSIIVNIPSELNGFKLTAFDQGTAENPYLDEIRVVTSHGTATYAFKVTAPGPSISRTQCRYPRSAGDVLAIYGKNLVDIERAYITDMTPEEIAEAGEIGGTKVDATVSTVVMDHHLNSNSTAYETDSELALDIPTLSFTTGSLVLECAGGTVYAPFSLYLQAPTILEGAQGLSTDMPVLGETVTIRGTEFIQVDAVKYGDVTLTEDQFTVADTEDEISFVFTQKPSRGSEPTLTVVTGGGEATVPFFNYTTLLTDFDDTVVSEDWGGGPKVEKKTADGVTPPYTSDGIYAHWKIENERTQWWGTQLNFIHDWGDDKFYLPEYDVIPADASADDVYLAMEIYNNNSDYNLVETYAAYLRYMMQPLGGGENDWNNQYDAPDNWIDYDANICHFKELRLADINGEAPLGKWYRHVISLSHFACYAGKTYGEIKALGLQRIRIMQINPGALPGSVDFGMDNVRIVYIKK
ncbi:MAG: hypothetical protein IJ710_00250 [Prevotella sp.]|nr:hypothetical protein [Prevotella sp.]